MTHRSVKDRLREEYFKLSPEIKLVLHQLQTEVAHELLPIALYLKPHERIHIEARAKECESAIAALERREEARQFDEDVPDKYTLTDLPDLAAVRVLVFPKARTEEIHTILRFKYPDWISDPVRIGTPPKFRAWKYRGHCSTSQSVQAELQIVSMLIGLFWRIEHDAFYKPIDAVLRGAVQKPTVRDKTERVYDAFDAFEDTLERELNNASEDVC